MARGRRQHLGASRGGWRCRRWREGGGVGAVIICEEAHGRWVRRTGENGNWGCAKEDPEHKASRTLLGAMAPTTGGWSDLAEERRRPTGGAVRYQNRSNPDPELGVLKTKLLRHKNWPGQEVVGDRGCDRLVEKKKCGTKTGRGGKPCIGCTCVGVPATGWLGLAILFHTQGQALHWVN